MSDELMTHNDAAKISVWFDRWNVYENRTVTISIRNIHNDAAKHSDSAIDRSTQSGQGGDDA